MGFQKRKKAFPYLFKFSSSISSWNTCSGQRAQWSTWFFFNIRSKLLRNSWALSKNDVTPALIMSRVEGASGAKYSAHKEQPRQIEPIAPVSTAHTPVGKVDIAALRKPLAKPTLPSSSSRSAFSAVELTASAGSVHGKTVNPAFAPMWMPGRKRKHPRLQLQYHLRHL